MSIFDLACSITIMQEGVNLDLTPEDRGNWTGGKVGVGVLRGSRYGISAAQYPDFDFANGTLDDAKAIYRPEYWNKIQGDALSPITAMTVFDAAVNCGIDMGSEFLQMALADRGYYHGRIDGQIGPMTMAALVHGSDFDIAMGLHQKRAQYMIHRATWSTFADGWENRLAGLPFIIMQAARTL